MNVLTGMEKFSHLEDKIYLTVEFAKKLREEREEARREVDELRETTLKMERENQDLKANLAALTSEREAVLGRVEAMLGAVTILDPEVAAAIIVK